ncbi:class A beta-lactamase-related serine hydrolase [Flavobacteriaceae bacterium AU392]|nr:class A beta-lactamase-related serine hydrolase [Flavobacteriaceae bacterium]RKM84087.1 class A beta-lactamase-related serine hydrolase [Flavobacteriaceae bacterium AU392]
MKSTFIKQLSLIGLIFMISCSSSTTPFQQNISIGSTNTIVSKIDSIIASKMNVYNIPGISIGIVRSDSIFYTRGYGLKSIVEKDTISENTVFHTASISKLLTAQMIMQLVANNKLRLNDRLIDIIPNLKYTNEQVKFITIKSLLNHTSGLPDINNYHWGNQNREKNSLKGYVLSTKLKLRHTPSTKYNYSNLGYDILGYVIEEVTKQSFESVIQHYVLNPYKMKSSSFNYFSIPNSKTTHPHSKWFDNSIYIRKVYPYTREHAPSSTLNASSKDLSYWMLNILRDLDTKSELKQMIIPSFKDYKNIGLGFQLYNLNDKRAIGHFGGDKGFRSFLLMLPEHQTGIVLLANCDYNEDFRQDIVAAIVTLLLD